MSLVDRRDGYYDELGYWQRTKFCFAKCRNCTCRPPFGRYKLTKEQMAERTPSQQQEGGE